MKVKPIGINWNIKIQIRKRYERILTNEDRYIKEEVSKI